MRAALLIVLAAVADEPKPEATAEVKGKVVVPAKLESFSGRTLEVVLYKYDPRQLEKSADAVDRFEVKPFAHTQGSDTAREFSLGKKEKLEEGQRYYLTLFVLDGKRRTHIGECKHAPAFCRVLTDGAPSEVSAVFREVRR